MRGNDQVLLLFGLKLLALAGVIVHCHAGDPIATSAIWFLGVPGLVLALAAYCRSESRVRP